jgi:hypothetical protein
MYMSRDIMYCKPGKVKDLVVKFKKMSDVMKKMGYPPFRLYTDVSGENYWTLVIEQDVERIDDMAEMARTTMSNKEIATALEGYHDLVQNGRRELYKVE